MGEGGRTNRTREALERKIDIFMPRRVMQITTPPTLVSRPATEPCAANMHPHRKPSQGCHAGLLKITLDFSVATREQWAVFVFVLLIVHDEQLQHATQIHSVCF